MEHVDAAMTVDSILKDHDPHLYGGGTGSRQKVDAYLPGSLFSLPATEKVACRRVDAKCNGLSACESLDPEFLKAPRRELDWDAGRKLIEAELQTRELQDASRVGHVLAFVQSIGRLNCKATLVTGGNCKGQATMQRTEKHIRNKNYVLVCSDRNMPLAPDSAPHSILGILDHIDQDILLKVMSGERITEETDNAGLCSRMISAHTGQKGKALCPFNHLRDGRPFAAKIVPLPCLALFFMFCPWESLHPEVARMAVVVPKNIPHTHPNPPPNKLTQSGAELYRECVRKVGIGATPLKVDKAVTTMAILGTMPASALFHPGLANRDVHFKLVQQVRKELENSPPAGSVKQSITLAHVWMEAHDHATFKQVWEEIQHLVKLLTTQPIGFKVIHKNGTFMGLNGDMEAALVLGFGDAFLPTIDRDELRGKINDTETLLCYVLRICYTHIDRKDHQRIRNFKYLDSPQAVEEFKAWVVTLPDPTGELAGWWNHKLGHSWLLPGAIQCLSQMPPDDWHLMEVTTNLGEAQHAWNNSQTGTRMSVIESFQK
ncbi:hypothetical protein B0H19DRAFT_1261391 [Mycena capillaripes]|nr:hypothetical protein B0H19DRAFT_1261391 [Mycena capillaripes]